MPILTITQAKSVQTIQSHMWEEFFSTTPVVPSKSYLEWGPWFTVILWLFVFGGCVGSFLNVVMLRGAKGDDYIFAPSRCPVCQHKIRFWHNLPLLGYLLLRGRCYDCKTPIPIRYFLWEVAFAALFVAIGIATPWL